MNSGDFRKNAHAPPLNSVFPRQHPGHPNESDAMRGFKNGDWLKGNNFTPKTRDFVFEQKSFAHEVTVQQSSSPRGYVYYTNPWHRSSAQVETRPTSTYRKGMEFSVPDFTGSGDTSPTRRATTTPNGDIQRPGPSTLPRSHSLRRSKELRCTGTVQRSHSLRKSEDTAPSPTSKTFHDSPSDWSKPVKSSSQGQYDELLKELDDLQRSLDDPDIDLCDLPSLSSPKKSNTSVSSADEFSWPNSPDRNTIRNAMPERLGMHVSTAEVVKPAVYVSDLVVTSEEHVANVSNDVDSDVFVTTASITLSGEEAGSFQEKDFKSETRSRATRRRTQSVDQNEDRPRSEEQPYSVVRIGPQTPTLDGVPVDISDCVFYPEPSWNKQKVSDEIQSLMDDAVDGAGDDSHPAGGANPSSFGGVTIDLPQKEAGDIAPNSRLAGLLKRARLPSAQPGQDMTDAPMESKGDRLNHDITSSLPPKFEDDVAPNPWLADRANSEVASGKREQPNSWLPDRANSEVASGKREQPNPWLPDRGSSEVASGKREQPNPWLPDRGSSEVASGKLEQSSERGSQGFWPDKVVNEVAPLPKPRAERIASLDGAPIDISDSVSFYPASSWDSKKVSSQIQSLMDDTIEDTTVGAPDGKGVALPAGDADSLALHGFTCLPPAEQTSVAAPNSRLTTLFQRTNRMFSAEAKHDIEADAPDYSKSAVETSLSPKTIDNPPKSRLATLQEGPDDAQKFGRPVVASGNSFRPVAAARFESILDGRNRSFLQDKTADDGAHVAPKSRLAAMQERASRKPLVQANEHEDDPAQGEEDALELSPLNSSLDSSSLSPSRGSSLDYSADLDSPGLLRSAQRRFHFNDVTSDGKFPHARTPSIDNLAQNIIAGIKKATH